MPHIIGAADWNVETGKLVWIALLRSREMYVLIRTNTFMKMMYLSKTAKNAEAIMDNKPNFIRKVALMMVGLDDWLIKKILGNLATKWVRSKTDNKDTKLSLGCMQMERIDNEHVKVHLEADLMIKDKDVLKLLSLEEEP